MKYKNKIKIKLNIKYKINYKNKIKYKNKIYLVKIKRETKSSKKK
jgi:hypothetical protein